MNSRIGSVFNSGAFVSSWFHLDFLFFSLVKHAFGWQMLPHCWTVGVFYSFILSHPVGDISTCHPSESTQMPWCLFITAFYSPCVFVQGKNYLPEAQQKSPDGSKAASFPANVHIHVELPGAVRAEPATPQESKPLPQQEHQRTGEAGGMDRKEAKCERRRQRLRISGPSKEVEKETREEWPLGVRRSRESCAHLFSHIWRNFQRVGATCVSAVVKEW